MLGKNNFYSLKNILKEKATYNVIFGGRSNGKTYAVLSKILTDFGRAVEKIKELLSADGKRIS